MRTVTFLAFLIPFLGSVSHASATTEAEDATVEMILARIDALIADNDVDAAVKKAIASLDFDNFLSSHAPGLYAIVVIGFVGAILNCVAIFVLFLWVRSMKGAVTQTDAGTGAV